MPENSQSAGGSTEWGYLPKAKSWSQKHIKECRCGGARWVRVNFPPDHPLANKAIPCLCLSDRQAREQADRLRRLSAIPEGQLHYMTFDTFDPTRPRNDAQQAIAARAKRLAEVYTEQMCGWLLLIGNNGTGKTHLATAIARRCLDDGRSVYMDSVPHLLDMLRAGYNEPGSYEYRMQQLADVFLLVLDDLGMEKLTEWAREHLFQVIDRRLGARKAMVLTSNTPINLMAGTLGKAICSRLQEGVAASDGWVQIIEMNGDDMRPNASRKEL